MTKTTKQTNLMNTEGTTRVYTGMIEENIKMAKKINKPKQTKKCCCGIDKNGDQIVCFKHGGLFILKTTSYQNLKKSEGKK